MKSLLNNYVTKNFMPYHAQKIIHPLYVVSPENLLQFLGLTY